MAILLVESRLPEGAMVDPMHRMYHYQAFCCDMLFFGENPNFDWQRHIGRTLHNCLAGTRRRFMKVT